MVRDRSNLVFLATLWICLGLAWAISGHRFADWVFEMPEIPQVSERLVWAAGAAQDLKSAIISEDLFGDLRSGLHAAFGLDTGF